MARETGRNTITGPYGDVFVIGRGAYVVRDGSRTVRSFGDEESATAFAKSYVGIEPEPVIVEVEVEPKAKAKK